MSWRSMIVAMIWITTAAVVCGGQQQSSASVPSLLEKEGFDAHCVSRALAQCQRDIKPQEASAADIHNLSEDIQQLGREVNKLQNATEALPLHALIQTFQNLSLTLTATSETSRPRHCRDLQDSGDSGRGARVVYPYACCPDWGVKVFCDQDTDGGGWTVVQRRDDLPPYEDFYRTWIEYEKGFGQVTGQFWLGLDTLHHLTSHSLQELRIDLADFDNVSRWAKYGFFYVGDSDTKYIMHCGRYNGDAGDGLSHHSGRKFSTHDQNNADSTSRSCAEDLKGAWWYAYCGYSSLNGEYMKGKTEKAGTGVFWHHWRGYHYSLRQAEMKIRPY